MMGECCAMTARIMSTQEQSENKIKMRFDYPAYRIVAAQLRQLNKCGKGGGVRIRKSAQFH